MPAALWGPWRPVSLAVAWAFLFSTASGEVHRSGSNTLATTTRVAAPPQPLLAHHVAPASIEGLNLAVQRSSVGPNTPRGIQRASHLSGGPLWSAVLTVLGATLLGLARRALWRPVPLNHAQVALLAVGGQDPCSELRKVIIEYPDERTFVAIGIHDAEYVTAMAAAAQEVLGVPIDPSTLKTRPSSNGKYLSVHIGPVTVASEEQVVAVYTALRRDARTKYCL